MKVLLIRPPQQIYPGSKGPVIGFPIGLLSIAATLEESGIKVKIFDSLAPEYLSGFRYSRQRVTHLGAAFQQIFQEIDRYDPALIGVAAPFTSQYHYSLKILTHLKSKRPRTPVIMGGPHATVRPGDFLFDGGADFVVLGEGEEVCVEIARNIAGEISREEICGAAYWEKGGIRNNRQIRIIDDLDPALSG